MPISGFPLILENVLYSLLEGSDLSYYKVVANQNGTTVVLRFTESENTHHTIETYGTCSQPVCPPKSKQQNSNSNQPNHSFKMNKSKVCSTPVSVLIPNESKVLLDEHLDEHFDHGETAILTHSQQQSSAQEPIRLTNSSDARNSSQEALHPGASDSSLSPMHNISHQTFSDSSGVGSLSESHVDHTPTVPTQQPAPDQTDIKHNDIAIESRVTDATNKPPTANNNSVHSKQQRAQNLPSRSNKKETDHDTSCGDNSDNVNTDDTKTSDAIYKNNVQNSQLFGNEKTRAAFTAFTDALSSSDKKHLRNPVRNCSFQRLACDPTLEKTICVGTDDLLFDYNTTEQTVSNVFMLSVPSSKEVKSKFESFKMLSKLSTEDYDKHFTDLKDITDQLLTLIRSVI